MVTRDLRALHERGPNGVCRIFASALNAGGAVAGATIQADAANHAADLAQKRYDLTRGDLMPYNQGGQADFTAANNLLTGSPSQIQANLQGLPGYQFARTQGLKAVQNSAAARGLGASGAALKGAASYATGLADQTYGEQVNRLMSGAQIGENAAAQTGVTGANLASTQGNALIQGGNAAAGGLAGAAGSISQGMMLNKLYGMYGAGGGGYNTFVPQTSGSGIDIGPGSDMSGLF